MSPQGIINISKNLPYIKMRYFFKDSYKNFFKSHKKQKTFGPPNKKFTVREINRGLSPPPLRSAGVSSIYPYSLYSFCVIGFKILFEENTSQQWTLNSGPHSVHYWEVSLYISFYYKHQSILPQENYIKQGTISPIKQFCRYNELEIQ